MISAKSTSDADTILKEIEASAYRKFLPIIGPIKGRYLVNTVKESGIKKVLEVGTLVGYSSIMIAKNLPDDGHVETIEINPQSAGIAEENIRKANLSGKIKVHIGNALKVLPGIKELFDMVFIDAAKTEYLAYLKLCEHNLKKNGVVFADNVKIFAGDMRDYLDYVRNSGRYSSQYTDLGFDGVEISSKLF
jgi:predicted O-methyltransferase YrrM